MFSVIMLSVILLSVAELQEAKEYHFAECIMPVLCCLS
jgi:hypothetical protein